MKKSYFMMGLLAMGLTVASCGDDDSTSVSMPEGTGDVNIDLDETDVDASNVTNWMKYAVRAASLLKDDATALYDDWNTSYDGAAAYKEQFKSHLASTDFPTAVSCVEQIIDGCIDISDEVGKSKIGDPRSKWEKGNYKEAVYAVESWYSFHSIDDYANNIRSIQNAFNGTRDSKTEATHSLATFLKTNNQDLYTRTKAAIATAISAIESMAAPFRNHIGNASVPVAQEACSNLQSILENEVKPFINQNNENAELQNIVDTYVDDVVVPTYKELQEKNLALYYAVKDLQYEPSTANFEAAAKAWMEARSPWETSEAFLGFGPVEDKGLDPNMDSWPLDQDAIMNILKSGDLSALEGKDAEGNVTEAARNVRGFHTLEFLIFKNGKARTFSK